jgi:hypothetical protein
MDPGLSCSIYYFLIALPCDYNYLRSSSKLGTLLQQQQPTHTRLPVYGFLTKPHTQIAMMKATTKATAKTINTIYITYILKRCCA